MKKLFVKVSVLIADDSDDSTGVAKESDLSLSYPVNDPGELEENVAGIAVEVLRQALAEESPIKHIFYYHLGDGLHTHILKDSPDYSNAVLQDCVGMMTNGAPGNGRS